MEEENKSNDKKELAIPRTGFTIKGELTVKGELAVKGELEALKELATRGELSVKGELTENEDSDRIIIVESIKDAVEYLKDTQGNILTATGSMELYEYTKITDYKDRVYCRVLSHSGIMMAAEKFGIEGRHLIGMTGPFSKNMNMAMLKEFQIHYLVTKDAGILSGFLEKMEAAMELGVTLIVVASPYEEKKDKEETLKRLEEYVVESSN